MYPECIIVIITCIITSIITVSNGAAAAAAVVSCGEGIIVIVIITGLVVRHDRKLLFLSNTVSEGKSHRQSGRCQRVSSLSSFSTRIGDKAVDQSPTRDPTC